MNLSYLQNQHSIIYKSHNEFPAIISFNSFWRQRSRRKDSFLVLYSLAIDLLSNSFDLTDQRSCVFTSKGNQIFNEAVSQFSTRIYQDKKNTECKSCNKLYCLFVLKLQSKSLNRIMFSIYELRENFSNLIFRQFLLWYKSINCHK